MALTLTLEEKKPLNHDVLDLRFSSDAACLGEAGQFLTLTLGKDPGGRAIRRSYSLVSSPGDARVRFWIKLIPGGLASTWFSSLKPGDTCLATGPLGFLTLDPTHTGPKVFACTGTGVAPFLPMLRTLAGDEGAVGGLRGMLLWGVRQERDVFAHAEIEAAARAAGFQLDVYVSRPAAHYDGLRGRIIDPAVSMLERFASPQFYLVGNGGMIKDLKAALTERGVDRKRFIRSEKFF
jgi:ferredoxin-NADP reductase